MLSVGEYRLLSLLKFKEVKEGGGGRKRRRGRGFRP